MLDLINKQVNYKSEDIIPELYNPYLWLYLNYYCQLEQVRVLLRLVDIDR